MRRTLVGWLGLGTCGFLTANALALGVTGSTGSGQPFSNLQPAQALNQLVWTSGLYPPHEGPSIGERYLGGMRLFAGSFAPGGTAFADGQLLPINQNQALFSLLGNYYGGNGQTTFALPDLRGRAAMNAGQGPGLSNRPLGPSPGAYEVSLIEDNLPAHRHLLTGGQLTGATGADELFSNLQPSVAMSYIVAIDGAYPSPDESAAGEPFLGEVAMFGGNFPPAGWAFADGRLMSVDADDSLFSILGTTYGGDGLSSFALPDLRGRVPVGVGQGPGLSDRQLGEAFGAEAVTLTESQLPAHVHSLPGGGDTESSGGNQPFDNLQPSLGLHYLIATQGNFPSPLDSPDNETFLGEVTLFAGNFAPRGWALAEGQLLPISQNQALFSLLGTSYGGDGQVTFALPDLRGRTALHAGSGPWELGEFVGEEQHALTLDELPPHQHQLFTPGDTDQDGDVDVTDLNNVLNNFGNAGNPVLGDTAPFDGIVSVSDLNAVRNNFGTMPDSQFVPEPASCLLALIAMLCVASGTFVSRFVGGHAS